eukprot:SAG31_NODE_147_length_22539_cov_37.073663_17_plen_520_part_00
MAQNPAVARDTSCNSATAAADASLSEYATSSASSSNLQHATEHLKTSIAEIEHQVDALRRSGMTTLPASATRAASVQPKAVSAPASILQAQDDPSESPSTFAEHIETLRSEQMLDLNVAPPFELSQPDVGKEPPRPDGVTQSVALPPHSANAQASESYAPTPASWIHTSWDQIDQMLRDHGLAAIGSTFSTQPRDIASVEATVRACLCQLMEMVQEQKCQLALMKMSTDKKSEQLQAEQSANLKRQEAESVDGHQDEPHHKCGGIADSVHNDPSAPGLGAADSATEKLQRQLAQKDYDMGILKRQHQQQVMAAEQQISMMQQNLEILLQNKERQQHDNTDEIQPQSVDHFASRSAYDHIGHDCIADDCKHVLTEVQRMLQVSRTEDLTSALAAILQSVQKLPGMHKFICSVCTASTQLRQVHALVDVRMAGLSETIGLIDEAASELRRLRGAAAEFKDGGIWNARPVLSDREATQLFRMMGNGDVERGSIFAAQCIHHFRSLFDVKDDHMCVHNLTATA